MPKKEEEFSYEQKAKETNIFSPVFICLSSLTAWS